jgi:hypothetical protein
MPLNRRPARPNKRQQASRGQSETRRAGASIDYGTPPAVVTYGKAFIIAEDAEKNTFVFNGSEWASYGESIAECKKSCLVKELPQKLKHMTRYEVRRPE